jgi:glycerophosphoryl diester phosphodiesterase
MNAFPGSPRKREHTARSAPYERFRGVGRDGRPQVIGHRGAPGYRPEHTLASYRLAIALGADSVEPDLVMTADGVAVLRHETEIGGTTDVAAHPEFADRRRVQELGGRQVSGWFCEDFTLAELKTLRAVERLPDRRPRSARWDGRFEVATFDELLLLLAKESRRHGRWIGLNAELKEASYLDSIGLSLEDAVLASLRDHGLDHAHSGVLLQSFEPECLQRLRPRTPLPLVQLVEDPRSALLSPAGLADVAAYADVLGMAVRLLLDRPGLVGPAHRAGLDVLAFTVRHDDPDGPAAVAAKVRALVDAGVDGLFSDQPDQTLAVCAGAYTSTSFGTITQATR